MAEFFERHALKIIFLASLLLFGARWLNLTVNPELAPLRQLGDGVPMLFCAAMTFIVYVGVTLMILTDRGHIRWSNTR